MNTLVKQEKVLVMCVMFLAHYNKNKNFKYFYLKEVLLKFDIDNSF